MKAEKKKDFLRLLSLIGVAGYHPAYDSYQKSCAPSPDDDKEQSKGE